MPHSAMWRTIHCEPWLWRERQRAHVYIYGSIKCHALLIHHTCDGEVPPSLMVGPSSSHHIHKTLWTYHALQLSYNRYTIRTTGPVDSRIMKVGLNRYCIAFHHRLFIISLDVSRRQFSSCRFPSFFTIINWTSHKLYCELWPIVRYAFSIRSLAVRLCLPSFVWGNARVRKINILKFNEIIASAFE